MTSMETFFALLAICAGNSPATGEFPTQRPVRSSFDVFFNLRLIEWLSKQWRGWWFETLSRPYDVTVMRVLNVYNQSPGYRRDDDLPQSQKQTVRYNLFGEGNLSNVTRVCPVTHVEYFVSEYCYRTICDFFLFRLCHICFRVRYSSI